MESQDQTTAVEYNQTYLYICFALSLILWVCNSSAAARYRANPRDYYTQDGLTESLGIALTQMIIAFIALKEYYLIPDSDNNKWKAACVITDGFFSLLSLLYMLVTGYRTNPYFDFFVYIGATKFSMILGFATVLAVYPLRLLEGTIASVSGR